MNSFEKKAVIGIIGGVVATGFLLALSTALYAAIFLTVLVGLIICGVVGWSIIGSKTAITTMTINQQLHHFFNSEEVRLAKQIINKYASEKYRPFMDFQKLYAKENIADYEELIRFKKNFAGIMNIYSTHLLNSPYLVDFEQLHLSLTYIPVDDNYETMLARLQYDVMNRKQKYLVSKNISYPY